MDAKIEYIPDKIKNQYSQIFISKIIAEVILVIENPIHTIAPENRDIGMVFQDYALFPHLNVWKNVCFGIRNNNDKSRAQWLLEITAISW